MKEIESYQKWKEDLERNGKTPEEMVEWARENVSEEYAKKLKQFIREMEDYGRRVRDFLLMLNAGRDGYLEADFAKAIEQAICCVEAAYPSIEPKVGRRVDEPMSVCFVRNRLKVLINFYSTRRYGYLKCSEEECGERMPDCPDQCRFRGWEDEYCNMIREAIRCVEVTGTGAAEPPTISLSSEDLL